MDVNFREVQHFNDSYVIALPYNWKINGIIEFI